MTLKELAAELGTIDDALKTLRRADYEISGDTAFAAALRQHIVMSIQEIRMAVDEIISSIDHVGDVERLIAIREHRPSLSSRIQKALTAGKDDHAG